MVTSMALTKKQLMDNVREEVIGLFKPLLTNSGEQIDSGSFIIPCCDSNDIERYVEVKFIVKGDSFDFEDAIIAWEDKQKKAQERIEAQISKKEAAAKKKAEKESKAK